MKPLRSSSAAAFVPTRGQRIAIRTSALLLSTAIGLLCGEMLVRVFRPHEARTPILDRVNGLKSYTPNVRGRGYVPGAYDDTETIGPQRFRGMKSYSLKPPAGTIRIAAIGDSFTFGNGANDDESYPYILERELRSRHWPVEVINAGVGDTGTGEQALYYEEYVRQFHPNIVILGVIGNDPSDDKRDALFRRDASGALVPIPASQRPVSRWWHLSHAIHRFPPIAWLYGHSELVSTASYYLHHVGEGPEPAPDLKLTQDEIVWLAHRTDNSGVQLVVAHLAWLDPNARSDRGNEERPPMEPIADAAARGAQQTGVPFIELAPDIWEAYIGGQRALFHRGLDTHPTALGYAVYAHAIADFLERDHVLATAQAKRASPRSDRE